MMTPQMHSVYVFVRDLDRALFFYCGTLGFPLRSRWEDGAEVGGHGTVLTLATAHGTESDEAGGIVGRATGVTFAVDRETYARLAARGVFIGEPVRYPWGTFAVVTDPDGNEFAFLAPADDAEHENHPAPRVLDRTARLAAYAEAGGDD